MKKEQINNSRFYFLIIVCFSLLQTTYSQQYPQYTQYTYNMNIVNPAYAGSRDALSINLLGRTQWVNVEGAPKTSTLTIHSPLGLNKNIGLGFSAIYDIVGPLKETHLYADASYSVDVSYIGKLAFGLKTGISFQNLDQSLLNFNTPEDIDSNLNNNSNLNFGFGIYYHQENLYFGLSTPNILNHDSLNSDSKITSETTSNNNFYINFGYVFNINENLQLKPSFMIKYASTLPSSFDISTTVFIQNKVEFGTSYRLNESISFLAAFFVNDNLRIGYNYDYSIGNLSSYSKGSHEIMLLFNLPRKENNQRIPIYY